MLGRRRDNVLAPARHNLPLQHLVDRQPVQRAQRPVATALDVAAGKPDTRAEAASDAETVPTRNVDHARRRNPGAQAQGAIPGYGHVSPYRLP